MVGPLLSGQLARDVGPAQRAACGLWFARNWIKLASASKILQVAMTELDWLVNLINALLGPGSCAVARDEIP